MFIGITGGIGSGKTYICNKFKAMGVPVYNADERAKFLMENDNNLIQSLKAAFGEVIYNGQHLNKKLLSDLVFNDKNALATLNSLVHPAVNKDVEKWVEENKHQKYLIKEAALLFESGAQKNLDYVIGVNAPYKLRLQRAMKRDKLTKEAVESRLNKQMDETKKMNLCNFIITNDEEQLLIPQVEELYRKLLNL